MHGHHHLHFKLHVHGRIKFYRRPHAAVVHTWAKHIKGNRLGRLIGAFEVHKHLQDLYSVQGSKQSKHSQSAKFLLLGLKRQLLSLQVKRQHSISDLCLNTNKCTCSTAYQRLYSIDRKQTEAQISKRSRDLTAMKLHTLHSSPRILSRLDHFVAQFYFFRAAHDCERQMAL